MGATYHATAIVLRREPWKDSARMYTLYTREWGKILAVGRGTAKTLSKLGPHLEPYSLVEAHIARGRRIETLAGAVMKRVPDALVQSEARHVAAAFFAEAADHFVKWSERDERLWNLFETYLGDISSATDEQVPTHLANFAWRLMDALGYRPALDECISCKSDVQFGGGLFLPARGVILCSSCRPDERHLTAAMPLHAKELAIISNHLKSVPASKQAFEGWHQNGEQVPASVLGSGLAFLEAHLDRPLNSLPIVRSLILERLTVPSVV